MPAQLVFASAEGEGCKLLREFSGHKAPIRKGKRKKRELPEEIIIFDTEARTDEAQSLLFGSYRVYIAGDFIEEGLFYPEDLTAKELRVLKRYARTHTPQTSWRGLSYDS